MFFTPNVCCLRFLNIEKLILFLDYEMGRTRVTVCSIFALAEDGAAQRPHLFEGTYVTANGKNTTLPSLTESTLVCMLKQKKHYSVVDV